MRETIKDGWNIDRGYLQKKRIDKRVLYSTHKSTRKNTGEGNRKMVAQIVKNLPVMQET